MESFRRIFKYVWPQWPRVIVVVVSALVVSTLLSLSFMTVIPLLKVIMGEEGLHGWVDRKTCDWRYGVDFYVPETSDFIADTGNDIAYCLLVTSVEKDSFAASAGLKPADKIVSIGDFLADPELKKIYSVKLLEKLATSEQDEIALHVKRLDQQNVLQDIVLKLETTAQSHYPQDKPPGIAERFQTDIKRAVLTRAQKALSFLPREQTKDNKTRAIIFIILTIGVVTVIRCIAKFYQGYLAEKVVQVGINHLREDMFSHVMQMPIGFFVSERPSDTVSRLIRDTSVMGKAIKIMLGKALREPLNALFMLSFAMFLNWQLTLIFLCGAPLVLGLVVLLGRKMKKATGRSLVAGAQMLSKLQETTSGLEVVKVYNQQEYERNRFAVINNRLLKQLLKISKVDAATSPVMEVLGMMAGSVALVAGAHWVTQNRMDGSEFLGLLILLGAAAEAIRKTSDIWNKIQEANAAAERVFAVVDEPTEFEASSAIEQQPLKEKIEFTDIVFTYPGADKPVLKGINLTVNAGHNIALVGPNGSGKTTLANLIPRLYNPDKGRILIDGRDIRDMTLFGLRSQIAMVTQNMVTFNDTIAANIAYGKSDATREEITEAAKRAFAHEFIEILPDGYDAVIGEHGTGLSGGQLQRIVIARAILKNPAILIFDEATSQVDADSEAKIHKAIEQIMKGRTSFVIAHRFSTIINADVIVVMDNGRIAAQGQHEELMHNCPLYQSLYETQLVKA